MQASLLVTLDSWSVKTYLLGTSPLLHRKGAANFITQKAMPMARYFLKPAYLQQTEQQPTSSHRLVHASLRAVVVEA